MTSASPSPPHPSILLHRHTTIDLESGRPIFWPEWTPFFGASRAGGGCSVTGHIFSRYTPRPEECWGGEEGLGDILPLRTDLIIRRRCGGVGMSIDVLDILRCLPNKEWLERGERLLFLKSPGALVIVCCV
jgi:hypothetical protein